VTAQLDAAPPPKPRCQPLSDRTSYTLCVIDELNQPIVGATVVASQRMIGEGFGDVGIYDRALGTNITDELGRVRFDLTSHDGGLLWSAKELERSATATVNGWPTEAADDHGFITLGPLRTITIRHHPDRNHRPYVGCEGTVTASIMGADLDAPLVRDPDGAYTASIGPGPYTVTFTHCRGEDRVSTQATFLGKDVPATGIEL